MVSDLRVKWCDSEKRSPIQLPAPSDSLDAVFLVEPIVLFQRLQACCTEAMKNADTSSLVQLLSSPKTSHPATSNVSIQVTTPFRRTLAASSLVDHRPLTLARRRFPHSTALRILRTLYKKHGSFVAGYPLKSSSGYSNSSPTTRTKMVHEGLPFVVGRTGREPRPIS